MYIQMSVADIVEKFGVSERTARRHRSKGTLPSDDRVKTMKGGQDNNGPSSSGRRSPHPLL